MKVVYFGSDDFGLPALEALAAADRHELVGVVSQPDRPAGRGRHLTPTPVSAWALQSGRPLIRPDSVNKPDPLAQIQAWGGDIGVVIAFGQKLGDPLLDGFEHGCVNLHCSLLPRYRGAAPVPWAVVNGERETGVTVFRLVEKMDAGPVVFQQATPVEPTETAGELRDRLAAMGPHAVLATLDAVAEGTAEFVEQDHAQATPAPKLSKADGLVDWSQSAVVIAARIRGLYPWPGVRAEYISHKGRAEQVVLVRAVAEAAGDVPEGTQPGMLLDDLAVATGLGAVRLLEVKPAGRGVMSWQDFVNGRHVQPGDRFCNP